MRRLLSVKKNEESDALSDAFLEAIDNDIKTQAANMEAAAEEEAHGYHRPAGSRRGDMCLTIWICCLVVVALPVLLGYASAVIKLRGVLDTLLKYNINATDALAIAEHAIHPESNP